MFPVGTIVIHKKKSEFGYGIIVQNFERDVIEVEGYDEGIVVVLWHGDEKTEIIEMPQIHPYSDLKILNTIVGFA